jgi:hypothetical protein
LCLETAIDIGARVVPLVGTIVLVVIIRSTIDVMQPVLEAALRKSQPSDTKRAKVNGKSDIAVRVMQTTGAALTLMTGQMDFPSLSRSTDLPVNHRFSMIEA